MTQNLTCFVSPKTDINTGQNFLQNERKSGYRQLKKEECVWMFEQTHFCTPKKLSSDWSGCLFSWRTHSQYSFCSSCRQQRVKRGGQRRGRSRGSSREEQLTTTTLEDKRQEERKLYLPFPNSIIKINVIFLRQCVCSNTHPCSSVLELCLLLDREAGGSGRTPPSSGNPGNRNLRPNDLDQGSATLLKQSYFKVTQ